MSKVFVTGADGFIGSHLVETLVETGHQVRALCLYNSFGTRGWLDAIDAKTLAEIDIVSGDIRDAGAMRQFVQGQDVVLNLAALIAIPYSYQAPQSYVDTNVSGTLNLLLAARDCGVERFIQTSTSEVYGTAQFVPITEDHPLNPQSPYAATKVASDQLALTFHRSFSMPVVVVRPFNTFGPRQSTRAVIPTIITQVLNKQPVKLGSLTPTRDFLYVRDTALGFVAAMKSGPSAIGQVVNLAANFEIAISDLAGLIAGITGTNLEIQQEEIRMRPKDSEVERLFGSNLKAKELLGWSPHYGGLDGFKKAMAENIAWFSQPKNLARYRHDQYHV